MEHPDGGYSVTAHWRGLLLLGNAQAEEELATLIQQVVPWCVDVFRARAGDELFEAFRRALRRLPELYAQFASVPNVAPDDRQRAATQLAALREAQQAIDRALGRVPDGRVLSAEEGKQVAGQVTRLLHAMVLFTDVFESHQRRQVLRALMQAAQALHMMASESRLAASLARHLPLYNAAFDALRTTLTARVDALAQMGEDPQRLRYAACLDVLQGRRARLVDAVEALTSDPSSLEAQVEVDQEVHQLSAAIQELSSLCATGAKASGGLDFERLERSLGALQEAVAAGSQPAAADAARELVQQVRALESLAPARNLGPGGPADGPERLKKDVKDLLGATKAAIADPSSDTNAEFARRLEAVRQEVELETIATTLLASGIIDAAAQVSAQLNALFASSA